LQNSDPTQEQNMDWWLRHPLASRHFIGVAMLSPFQFSLHGIRSGSVLY
jgi:hypothetical protein